MLVYLLRHAIAAPRGVQPYPNDDRPLTEEGIEKMLKGVMGIVHVLDDVDIIFCAKIMS